MSIRILAVIGFDLANESLIKTVISELAKKPVVVDGFHDCIDEANRLLRTQRLPELTEIKKIKHIHGIRNDAQHRAKYPNEVDVNDAQTYTRDFISNTVKAIWNEDFEKISLADLIQSDEIREYIVKAQDRLIEGEFTDSVVSSMIAFDRTKFKIRAAVIGSSRPLKLESKSKQEERAWESLQKELNTLRNLQMYSVIGIDFRGYRRFGQITSGIAVHHFGGDKYSTTLMGRGQSSETDAEFALEFVTNSVLKMERFVGDVDNPLDLDPKFTKVKT